MFKIDRAVFVQGAGVVFVLHPVNANGVGGEKTRRRLLGNGPIDQGFVGFHPRSDELLLDGGVPASVGNVLPAEVDHRIIGFGVLVC